MLSNWRLNLGINNRSDIFSIFLLGPLESILYQFNVSKSLSCLH